MQEQDVLPLAAETAVQRGEEHGPHRGSLGPLLCWGVVFADIGTSVYYTPGILFNTPGVGYRAALFVTLTTIVFVLLTFKYAEVAIRYPQGGGVVTVGARAIHPFVGLLGGMFILVDYFLTAALSALSGVIYLSDVFKNLTPFVTQVTLAALVILGILNWVGIRESAKVSLTFAALAFASQIAVLLALLIHPGPARLIGTVPLMLRGSPLSPLMVLKGYAGAFLAFSGLESISQLSPVMAQPRQRVARAAMRIVVITIVLTSPFLTLFSTMLLNAAKDDPNQFISHLGGFAAGPILETEVAITGALLLIFASNTAIIGSYHVFLALARMQFFPRFIEQRNRLRRTPHWAITCAVGIPFLILIAAQGSVNLLGDLYAFGLLGAFSLTCLSLDIVRWRERRADGRNELTDPAPGRKRPQDEHVPVGTVTGTSFVLGIITTIFVLMAWFTNLVAKPLATEFGGGVTAFGLAVAATNYYILNRRGRPIVFPTDLRAIPAQAVLVVLPKVETSFEDLVRAAASAADGRPVVFLYHGTTGQPMRTPRLFEVIDPYLEDTVAQGTFARVERLARRLKLDRRYVYIPGGKGPDAVLRAWQFLRPRDTLVTATDDHLLHDIAPDRVRRPHSTGIPIIHYLKQW